MLPLCNRFVSTFFVSSFVIACEVGNGTSCAIFSVLHGRYEIVPAVQYFPYCTAGTKLYLPCNIFRIAWQVRNGTSYAIFTDFCGFFRIARQVHGFLYLGRYL